MGKRLTTDEECFIVALHPIATPAFHNIMNSLYDLVHHFYGYDKMLVRLVLLMPPNSHKMEENLLHYSWMGMMNIQMIYNNTVLLPT